MPKKPFLFHLAAIATVPLSVGAYAVWYWNSTHSELAAWYRRLNPNFYRAATWETELFTPAVKSAGNGWCALALVAVLGWAFIKWKSEPLVFPKIGLKKKELLAFLLLAILGFTATFFPNRSAFYSSDEVFSAVNYASYPLFQTISNYTLPNNHIFFNALNHVLFFWSDDKVLTGRFISLFCYVAVLIFTWIFLKKWTSSIWLQCLILLVLSMQFPAWGFAFQARGYELVLLCSCISLGSFMAYFISRSTYYLPIHVICNAIGIMALPTYLYWWLGLLLASVVLQLISRKIDKAYIKYSLSGFVWSLILALPLLTFSGIRALADNRFVQQDASTWRFIMDTDFGQYFGGLFIEWYCLENAGLAMGAACLALPAMLFIYHKNDPKYRVFGVAYYSIVFAFIFMAAIMSKLPFYRNLIAHGYLTLMTMIVAVLPLFSSKKARFIFGAFLLLVATAFVYKNHGLVPNNLYYYNVEGDFNKLNRKALNPALSKAIYLDDEATYWWYVLRKKYPDKPLVFEFNRSIHTFSPVERAKLIFLTPADSTLYQLQ
jgi:hypothetical protein